MSTCCVPGSPIQPAPWPWTSPCRPGGAAAGTPAKPRPWATVDLVAAGHGQPPYHRFPSGPMQAGDHPPGYRGHLDPLRPAGRPPHPATPGPARRGPRGGSAADSAACPSGHLDTGRLDTWTPDPDVGRPLDGLDGRPTAGPGRGQGNDQRGRRPDILAPATPRWAARPHPGHSAWGRSATRTAPRRRHLCWGPDRRH